MLLPSSLLPSLLDAFILLLFTTRSAGSTSSSSALCPSSCPDGGVHGIEWSTYHNMNELSICDSPLLLDFNVHNALDNPETHISIHACSTNTPSRIFARDATGNGTTSYTNSTACGIPLSQNTTSHFSIIQSGAPNSTNVETDLDALLITQYRLAHQNTTSCKSTTSFIMVGDSVVGVYTGASVPVKPFSDQVLGSLIADITNYGAADSVYIESCSIDPKLSSQNMGIVIGSFSAMPLVQSVVSAWAHDGCMITNSTANSTATSWQSFNLPLLSQPPTASNASTNSTTTVNFTPRGRRRLSRRDDCTTVQVKSGDSCASLATECGISGDDFTKYNSDPSLCSTLSPGQHVCCSAGSLPDFSPKPQADGTCATHSVVTDDTCSGIASANSITIDDIGNWNNNTWQFMGCNNLQIGQVICISTGDPPMPAAVQNAICGPQVPGTQKPDNISISGALASLNPCPLKVCCDIWGQCGNTDEFCTISQSATGAPGTAASGENGCISNCGTDIISGDPPAKPFTVGYFEGFNQQRPCLNMDASEIDVNSYTHLHFGFATISESFDVVIDDNSTAEWDQFRALSGPSIILSFGGWAFSTDVASYSIFRNAVTEDNRQTFAQNIASFVSSSGIGGVDFDWEYPGAPDIPGKLRDSYSG
jgi:chitinase